MAIDGIQSVSGSSVGALLFQALAASGAFSVSETTQNRLASLQGLEGTIATRLEDLSTLRSLLSDLSSAAAALRPAPTTFGSTLSVQKIFGDNDDYIELDETEAADLKTGDKITFSATEGGISANTTYFVNVINTDANSKDVRLYNTREAAINADGTELVHLTDVNNPTVTAKQIIPQPESQITALFDAYNELQDFLAEQKAKGGSLAEEKLLSGLGSKLLETVRSAIESSELSPAISLEGTSREITINSDVLSDQLDSHATAIASLFDENGSNIGNELRKVADFYTSVVDTLAATLDEQSFAVTNKIGELLQQSEKEQAAGFTNIGKIAGTISLTQLRIQFLSTLGG